MDRLELEIKALSDKLALKKQRLAAKKEVSRRKQAAKDRRARAVKIHRLGAQVEKMGLDNLEEEIFLGALAWLHGTLSGSDSGSFLEQYRQEGRPFLVDGKRLDSITV